MKGEKLVSWIHQTAEKSKFSGIELATVTSPYPDFKIRIDGMDIELGSGFLVIPNVFFSDQFIVNAGWNTTGKTTSTQTQNNGSHTHSIPQLNVESITLENAKTEIRCVLEVGDRVAVIAALGGNRYMILDKVVMP